MRFSKLLFAAAVLILAAGAETVRGDTITIVGLNSGQFSTATVVCEFTPRSATNIFDTLTFTITNTSHITQPGSTSTITGIGFDLPPLGSTSLTGINDFDGFQIPNEFASFGFRDFNAGPIPEFPGVVLDFWFKTGVTTSGFVGSVEFGLLPGESASFIVTGVPLRAFTEEQICNAIFIRFLNVPLAVGSGGTDVGASTNPIPEPSSILLLGSALAGLGGFARRKMK